MLDGEEMEKFCQTIVWALETGPVSCKTETKKDLDDGQQGQQTMPMVSEKHDLGAMCDL